MQNTLKDTTIYIIIFCDEDKPLQCKCAIYALVILPGRVIPMAYIIRYKFQNKKNMNFYREVLELRTDKLA